MQVKRPTMADIARRAGVSKVAVSYALNDQPGVSEATRASIKNIAEELGWRPNSAARALTGGRAQAVGLIVRRPARTLGVEPFFMEFISGVEAVLAEHAYALMLQMAGDQEQEIEVCRRWWGERRVDGVFLMDLRTDDERVGAVREIGLPAVAIGPPEVAGGVPAIWSDDGASVYEIVRYLALAPWLPEDDVAAEPEAVRQLVGRRVLLVHGTNDARTDPELSFRYAERAKKANRETCRFEVHSDGHALRQYAAEVQALAADFVLGALFARPVTRPVTDAMAAPPPLGLRMPLAAGFGGSLRR